MAAPSGLLLVNLGTPDAPTPAAVRRYLGEFLADPRVVELPRLLWRPILHGVVLRVRPRRSAAAYRAIWRPEGSPLLLETRALGRALEEALAVPVAVGMRYGQPSLAAALDELTDRGVERVVVLPLYPQYCAATTASTFDGLAAALRRRRRLPSLYFLAGYHDHPAYLDACAAAIAEHRAAQGAGERLLLSFHGMPEKSARAGDPYRDQCLTTAAAIAERLGLGEGQWLATFQSRFGPGRWLTPYTDATLLEWAREGVRAVDVFCPGFAVDCLETLEEIGERYRELFLNAGGERFSYIPALNSRPAHVAALTDLVRPLLSAH